jgi:hypothetical protein
MALIAANLKFVGEAEKKCARKRAWQAEACPTNASK